MNANAKKSSKNVPQILQMSEACSTLQGFRDWSFISRYVLITEKLYKVNTGPGDQFSNIHVLNGGAQL